MDAIRVAALRMLPGYSDITAADLSELLPTDKYTDELIVMADVRSYFQVVYKGEVFMVPVGAQSYAIRADARRPAQGLAELLGVHVYAAHRSDLGETRTYFLIFSP
uniref:Cerato-platanin-like protein 2 n=1 Tax=Ganoderma boninense TaxID=34458 RepID=A0A5K1K4U9_9APHY|nr:Cerato-platanin-like protein 2 [Ganoderma boninense]